MVMLYCFEQEVLCLQWYFGCQICVEQFSDGWSSKFVLLYPPIQICLLMQKKKIVFVIIRARWLITQIPSRRARITLSVFDFNSFRLFLLRDVSNLTMGVISNLVMWPHVSSMLVLQFKRNGGAYLHDLGSTHGTFVNKNQVSLLFIMNLLSNAWQIF